MKQDNTIDDLSVDGEVGVIPKSYPPPHSSYLVERNGVIFTATPCYGMHAPWWVVRSLSGEAAPEEMQDGDLWRLTWFDLEKHLFRQIAFSEKTFGPGSRVAGVIDHIAKELIELRDSGGALEEWVDIIILAFDGAWRSGATPRQITDAIVSKQTKNEGRSWPDWHSAEPGKAIEHHREEQVDGWLKRP